MTAPTDTLALVERELERIGLLLQHDSALPSVTTLVAGEPIHGSWWGHPRGQDIYQLLTRFEDGAGRLSIKLVAGKITYLSRALWPSFLALRAAHATPAARRLSEAARELYAHVGQRGQLRLDALAESGFAPKKALSDSAHELEASLLVHVSSLHTSSGAHVKQLRSWAHWAAEHAPREELPSPSLARSELERAVARLCENTESRPKLALLTSA